MAENIGILDQSGAFRCYCIAAVHGMVESPVRWNGGREEEA